MPRFIRKCLLWCLPLFAFFASCSEDFNVGAPYKLVTVAYGMLNTDDTAHYIRIQKAYFDENNPARDLALIYDSSFYHLGDITVTLRDINGTTGAVFSETLQRVDLNLENAQKDTGTFFRSPNYAYKTTRYLDPNNKYRLVITNNVTGERDSAETPVIPTDYNRFRVYQLTGSGGNLSFPLQTDDVEFLGWYFQLLPGSAKYFEETIRFHYASKTPAGVETRDSFDYLFASGTTDQISGATPQAKTTQKSFYQILKDKIGPAPSGSIRYLDSATFIVWAAGSDYYDYKVRNGAIGGLTADQIKPTYTNFQGANIYGLFNTRARLMRRRVPIDDKTLDAIMSNSITKELNINKRP